jgi:galactose mutarotase-like enzyme
MIRLSSNNIIAEISSKGAELQYLSKTNGENIMWSVDDAYWNRCAPILFPIVGKLKNDRYNWNDISYTMKQHGFARDMEFQLIEQSAIKAVFQLETSEVTLENYPFHFQLIVEYRTEGNKLITTYAVKNTGEKAMPFSIGGHPGFALNDDLENYFLQFPNETVAPRHLIKEGFYTGETSNVLFEKKYRLKKEDFSQDAIVVKQPFFNEVTLVYIDQPIVSMHCSDWTAVGFWTKEDAPFFCIEPWWGWADNIDSTGNFKDKEGLNWLQPHDHRSFSYSIEVH